MRLHVLLLCLLRAPGLELKVRVWSYRGESITLASGGNPAWSLSEIRWFVYDNDTVIASFYKGKTSVQLFHLYTGRLDLNTSSGDLTIGNLTPSDSLDYNVELVNTQAQNMQSVVTLRVREPLPPPAIQMLFKSSKNGSCWVALKCWHPDRDVDLTWSTPPRVSFHNISGPDGRLGLLLRFPKDLLPVPLLTCKASKAVEHSASEWAADLRCEDDSPVTGFAARGRCGLYSSLGLTVGVLLTFMSVARLTPCLPSSSVPEAQDTEPTESAGRSDVASP